MTAAERGDETGNHNMLIIDQMTLPPNVPGSLDLNVPWAGLPHCHPAAHYIWWSATGRCRSWLSSSTKPTPATATDRLESNRYVCFSTINSSFVETCNQIKAERKICGWNLLLKWNDHLLKSGHLHCVPLQVGVGSEACRKWQFFLWAYESG